MIIQKKKKRLAKMNNKFGGFTPSTQIQRHIINLSNKKCGFGTLGINSLMNRRQNLEK